MEPELKFRLLTECSYVARLQIELNPVDLEKNNLKEYLYVNIISDTNDELIRCLVLSNDKVEVRSAKLSKRCLNLIGKNKEFIYVQQIPFEFVNRSIPKIENINRKEVFASRELIEKYTSRVELVNFTNGYRMIVKLKSSDSSQHSNKVFINRYHLLLLGLDKDVNGKLVIISGQAKNNFNLFKRLILWIKLFLIRTIRKVGYFFIGYRELDLRVGYIYPFDENHKVARMHPNIRKFLGLEENDRLVVSYDNKRCSLPVLDLDTDHVKEVFKIENEFIDSHLYIGIPATTRNQLAVPNIGSVIKVRRSMKFLLKKHINNLILPLLGLIFAIVSTIKAENLSQIVTNIVLVLIISPVVIFASLSEERAKVK
ncbi:hypothetical protein ACFSO7_01100 [Bacillus sp. CGMCC 1.16607]|uniref:hypothetical protein n=1 Tax=Bacillus sp. CGMCC 1.16607 TaxID=3351842 RepID=UPI00363CE088